MISIFIITAVLSSVLCEFQVGVHDCGSKGGHIDGITVEGCDVEPCVVHRGLDYTIHINFTAGSNFSEAHTILHGGLGIFSLPFPIHPENACNGSVQCPIVAGESYTYTVQLTCPSFAPSWHLASKWEMKDKAGRDILCFAIPLSVS